MTRNGFEFVETTPSTTAGAPLYLSPRSRPTAAVRSAPGARSEPAQDPTRLREIARMVRRSLMDADGQEPVPPCAPHRPATVGASTRSWITRPVRAPHHRGARIDQPSMGLGIGSAPTWSTEGGRTESPGLAPPTVRPVVGHHRVRRRPPPRERLAGLAPRPRD